MDKKSFYFHNLETKEVFKLRDEMIIGRNEGSDIVIANPKISGKHLQFFINEDAIYIEDLKTSNGTSIDGLEAKPYSRYELQEGAKIILGGVSAFVYSESEEINLKEYTLTGIEKSRFTSSGDVKASGGARIHASNIIQLDIGGSSPLKNEDLFGEKEVQRQIKQYNVKVEKLLDEIEIISKKIKKRESLVEQLAQIEEVYPKIEQEALAFKDDYMENKDTWESLASKIKIVERDLNRLKHKKEELAPKMQKYDEFLEFKNKKQQISIEYKNLKRDGLEDKKADYEVRVQEVKKLISSSKHQLHQIAIKKDELRQREKNQIKAQIAELQKKLDDAG